MAEEFLHGPDVISRFEHMGGEAVLERVAAYCQIQPARFRALSLADPTEPLSRGEATVRRYSYLFRLSISRTDTLPAGLIEGA